MPLYYVCTWMLFLYFNELLIDETNHEVDLAIKQSLELLAC